VAYELHDVEILKAEW